jgi:hypothetical protein
MILMEEISFFLSTMYVCCSIFLLKLVLLSDKLELNKILRTDGLLKCFF